MSLASNIVEQLLLRKGLDGWHDALALRAWLKQEGNPERTLEEVIGLLAEHGANPAVKEVAVNKAAKMLQRAINCTALGHHNVQQLIDAESWNVVPSLEEDEWMDV